MLNSGHTGIKVIPTQGLKKSASDRNSTRFRSEFPAEWNPGLSTNLYSVPDSMQCNAMQSQSQSRIQSHQHYKTPLLDIVVGTPIFLSFVYLSREKSLYQSVISS
jgi:hypothetical protein